MPAEPFRFVHAADLHLDEPVQGLTDVPDHLRAALIDAPYVAAEHMFDAVLAESADFLVLSGDVLNVHFAGPRALTFLMEQFERLAARDVSVYWAGGIADPPESWPKAAKLPPNVHLFSRSEVEELIHYRHEEPLCRVAGISSRGEGVRSAEFHADTNSLFTVAVVPGRAEAETLALRPVDYWALGGMHQRHSLFTTPRVAHYCGTTQGRSPQESGPQGCTLVTVEAEGKVRTQLVVTDAVRWHLERLTFANDCGPDELRRLLGDRVRALLNDARERTLLIHWKLAAAGPLEETTRLGWHSRRAALAAELVGWLREDFGAEDPAVWTASLEFEPLSSLPQAWSEEDTILGDFLRAVNVHEADERQPLDVTAYLSPAQRESELVKTLALGDTTTRRQILREAAALGVELLRGE